MEIAKETRGLEKAKKLSEKYTDKAFKLIAELPENGSKHVLIDVTEKLLVRQF